MIARLRYLRLLTATALGILFAAAALNLVADPYGYFRFVTKPGFNSVKPRPDHSLIEIKRAGVEAAGSNALILGNSRAEVGLDPENPAWSEHGLSAYNFGLPGTTIRAAWEVFDEQVTEIKPKRLLIGVEFLDFLTPPDARPPRSIRRKPTTVLQNAQRYANALFTWSALADSVRTLGIQDDESAATITARGFNPLREYVETARIDGYYALFRQRAAENAAQYVGKPRSVRLKDGTAGPAFHYLRAILRTAAQAGVQVDLLIYPYHAQVLLMFEAAGLWPAFEDWKRLLVDVVAEEQLETDLDVRLWDFSGFSDYSTENIPARGDRKSTTRWYWEGGHFKRELGDVIIGQVLTPDAISFGVKLDRQIVDGHVQLLRAERDAFRESNKLLSAEVSALVRRAKRGHAG